MLSCYSLTQETMDDKNPQVPASPAKPEGQGDKK
jgi:hypothetical protein